MFSFCGTPPAIILEYPEVLVVGGGSVGRVFGAMIVVSRRNPEGVAFMTDLLSRENTIKSELNMNQPKIAVVMPIKDEELIIGASIAAAIAALENQGVNFRIVCVDDGSRDQTWSLLSEIALLDERVIAVQLARNFGHDAALFAGMSVVDADAYVTMDCDGQHPFSLLPEIIALWQSSGSDVVNCVKRDRGDEGLGYRLAVGAFGRFLSFTMKQSLRNATEFKLLSRRAVNTLLSMEDSHIFYRALVPWMGLKQAELKFDVGEGMRANRHWHFFSLIRFALSGLVMFSDYPIRLIFWLGAFALSLCFLLLIKLGFSLFLGDVPLGYSTILVLLMLNLGFTMIGLGVIGMYVHTTLRQTIGRPRAILQNIVKEKLFQFPERTLL